MVKAAAVARRLVTARAMSRRGVTERCGLPPNGRVMAMMSVAAPIWRVASRSAGTRCEVWARARRWPAKAIAHARVRRSPGPMLTKRFWKEVPAGVVRRSRPEKARSAPMAVVQRGGGVLADRSAGMIVRRGTKTTTKPVMKADFAGVVRASPAVWN
jgi:hypothetical protein